MPNKTSASLTIRHVATGLSVRFDKYFLTEFQDAIDTSYNPVSTFGRMDPIMNYQGSTRKITVGLEIQPENEFERNAAHKYSSILQKMQYPVYERSSNALTIQRPPIVVVRLGNLIRSGDNKGLICALSGYTFGPKTGFTPEDSPFIHVPGKAPECLGDAKHEVGAKDKVLFTAYNFKFDLTVLHNLPVGFSSQPLSDISDPDKTLYDDSNMRFLGGYYFGNHVSRFTGDGEPVYADIAGANTDVNKQADTDEAVPDSNQAEQ